MIVQINLPERVATALRAQARREGVPVVAYVESLIADSVGRDGELEDFVAGLASRPRVLLPRKEPAANLSELLIDPAGTPPFDLATWKISQSEFEARLREIDGE
jgi:hypothetical protein